MSAKLQPTVHRLRLQTVFPETQDRAAGKVLQPLSAVSEGVGGGQTGGQVHRLRRRRGLPQRQGAAGRPGRPKIQQVVSPDGMGWTRDDCIRQIEAAGLPQPGKSSCFFCPSMKPDEITALREQHPDLFRRALALEDNARQNLKTVKGLGRNYSWRERFGKEFCTHGNG